MLMRGSGSYPFFNIGTSGTLAPAGGCDALACILCFDNRHERDACASGSIQAPNIADLIPISSFLPSLDLTET